MAVGLRRHMQTLSASFVGVAGPLCYDADSISWRKWIGGDVAMER